MCLYPKLILNRKYLPNKKNGGIPPKCPDERLRYVTAACGKCYECRKQKARGWLVRMEEELRHNPNAIFITLTLEDKWYKNIEKKYNITEKNINKIMLVSRFGINAEIVIEKNIVANKKGIINLIKSTGLPI